MSIFMELIFYFNALCCSYTLKNGHVPLSSYIEPGKAATAEKLAIRSLLYDTYEGSMKREGVINGRPCNVSDFLLLFWAATE